MHDNNSYTASMDNRSTIRRPAPPTHRVLKVRVPRHFVIALHNHKIVRGCGIGDSVVAALEMYFAARRNKETLRATEGTLLPLAEPV